MLGAHGLYGHIRHNTMKSAALLSGFAVMMCISWYAWCVIHAAIVHSWLPHMLEGRRRRSRASGSVDTFDAVADIFHKALDTALHNWWVPLFLTAMWFVVAYLLHADMIRMATGARPITRKEEPKLYNMVENLAIAAGLPMPRLEIIRSGALNAYASGLSPEDAVVAVTTGLVKALTDEELEAVLAHEMTHIKNHDVRLMVVANCFAGGLTLVGDGLARWLFPQQRPYDELHHSYQYDFDRTTGVNRRVAAAERVLEAEAGAPIAVVISILIAIVFLAMAHVTALLINFAISRAREFMADAGAVELTKKPDALIAALNKISGNDEIPGLNANVKAMMISASVDGYFATHPPIETRVMALQQYAGGRVVERAPRRGATVASSTIASTPMPAAALGIAGGRATFGRKRAFNA
jgi:heat shock protein HtpX